jgi:hypothetical protein
VVSDVDAAQARIFVSALREQIGALTARLAKVESHTRPGRSHRDLVMRREANELRREISTAYVLIDRLHCRYPQIGSATA